MSPIGDLARQDDYGLPDVGQPLIPSGPQFSPGVPAVNQAMGSLLAPRPRDPNSPIAYRTASPLVNITEQDIADATETAQAFSGGGLGIKAYHGSPHDFERFDLSKIGTGEGAQVYGHGLYFAEHEPVARGYRERLAGESTPWSMKIGEKDAYKNRGDFDERTIQGLNELHARMGIYKDPSNPLIAEQLRKELAQTIENYQTGAIRMDKYRLDDAKAAQAVLNHPEFKVTPPITPGHMYEVDIKADPAHFLDWDKPLREQPKAAQDIAREAKMHPDDFNLAKGAALYRRAGDLFGPQRGTSNFNAAASAGLREAGIPGIKYLDQQSRVVPGQVSINRKIMNDPTVSQVMRDQAKVDLAKWERENQTSNYVVFNPGIIDILRKYGIAGAAPLGMGALAAQDQYNQP